MEDMAGRDDTELKDSLKELRDLVGNRISALRTTDRRNPTANDLVSLYNSLETWRSRPKANTVMGAMGKFSKAVKDKYGDNLSELDPVELNKNIIRHAKDVIEGKSLPASFGTSQKGTAGRRFNPSEVYVQVAERKGGRDVSDLTVDPNKATKHLVDGFGIRGFQWGNYVTDDERKHHAGKTVEALTDLSDILGIKPQDVSLAGNLGMAVGARGRAGAVAHYEPDSKVINLTRANGVGSLAHEWGHAFDHYLNEFGRDMMSNDTKPYSQEWQGADGRVISRPVDSENPLQYGRLESKVTPRPRSEMRKAFKSLRESQKVFRNRLHGVLRQAVRDKSMSAKQANSYWNSEHEIFARTFERYIERKLGSEGRKNTYLAGLEAKDHKFGGLWPTDEEADAMIPAFDKLFEAFRKEQYGNGAAIRMSLADRWRIIKEQIDG